MPPSWTVAPSYALQQFAQVGGFGGTSVTQVDFLAIGAALAQGWIVAVPDHLGPKAAFLANINSGQSTLDGIRAALASQSLTGIKPDARVAMWGYSGGSLASGFAAGLQPSYAPELSIAGTALGGTVPNISTATQSINKGFAAGLVPAGILGLSNEYTQHAASLQGYYVPSKKTTFDKTESQCLGTDITQFAFQDVLATYFTTETFLALPSVEAVMNANAMGSKPPEIPIFIYKSINDEISPVADTDRLYSQYCAGGTSVEYHRDLISEHALPLITGIPSTIMWLKQRLAGPASPQGCSEANVTTSLLDPTTSSVLDAVLAALLISLENAGEQALLSGGSL